MTTATNPLGKIDNIIDKLIAYVLVRSNTELHHDTVLAFAQLMKEQISAIEERQLLDQLTRSLKLIGRDHEESDTASAQEKHRRPNTLAENPS